MQLARVAGEDRVVRGLLDERVLEQIQAFRRQAAAEDDLALEQPVEIARERLLVHRGRLRQKGAVELAADHRRDLGDVFGRVEPFQPGHQRAFERGRHGQGLPPGDGLGLNHHLGQLLGEQRHAVRLLDQLLHDVRRQRLALGQPRDQLAGFLRAEAAQGELERWESCFQGASNSGRNVSSVSSGAVACVSMS